MNNNPLDRIPSFDRLSIRAVLVRNGEDPTQALAAAGIFDPVALPVMVGEAAPGVSFGDGFSPNLTVVLEPDAPAGDLAAATTDPAANSPGARPGQAGMHRKGAPPSGPATNLPPAFGLQPLAPVDKPGRRGRMARRPAAPPPTPSLEVTQQHDHSTSQHSRDDRK
jgi:hypothetical protein